MLKLKTYQKEILIFLSFITLAFIVFYPSFLNQNFFWDDERFIFLNPELLQAPTWYSFWSNKSAFYKSWPLGYSFFWLLLKYSHFNTFNFYKSLNIIFHGFNGYLVYHIIKKFNCPKAYWLALIFLIHPLQVETVSWIFQLLTILAFSFFLMSFLFLMKFSSSNNIVFLVFSVIFFVFSLWTKSIVLFSPFLFILTFWIFHVERKLNLMLIPFFIISLYIGIVNIKGTQVVTSQTNVQEKSIPDFIFKIFDANIQNFITPPPKAIVTEDTNKQYFDFVFKKNKPKEEFVFNSMTVFKQAPWHYFSKTILPLNLQFIYPSISYSVIKNGFGLFTIFLLPLFFILYFKDKFFLIIPAMSIVFLTPYLGLTNITFFYWSNVSDRYAYFFILTFSLTIGLIGKRYNNKVFAVILGGYCLFLTAQNFNYGLKFNQPLLLYKEIVTYKPHPIIYSLLFEQYFLKLDAINAEKTLDTGLLKFPNDPQLNEDTFRMNNLKKFYKLNNN